MNADVDTYIARSQMWPEEMAALRPILLDCGLTEEIKWGKPCYSHDGKNIAIMQEMKDFLALMFFKGALLSDPAGVLRAQGPNSRSALRIEFTSVDDVTRLRHTVAACVDEAIAVEAAGLEIGPAPDLVLVERAPAASRRRPGAASCVRVADPRPTAGVQPASSPTRSRHRPGAARVDKYAPEDPRGQGSPRPLTDPDPSRGRDVHPVPGTRCTSPPDRRSRLTAWGPPIDCSRSRPGCARRPGRPTSSRMRCRGLGRVRDLVRRGDVGRRGGPRGATPSRRHRADRARHGTDLRHARPATTATRSSRPPQPSGRATSWSCHVVSTTTSSPTASASCATSPPRTASAAASSSWPSCRCATSRRRSPCSIA